MNKIVWVVLLEWASSVELMGAFSNETEAQEYIEELYDLLDYPKSAFSLQSTRYKE